MAIGPVQSALSSALSGLRGATADADKAAAEINQATLPTAASYASSTSSATTQASPDLYSAVASRIEARQRFSTSLSVLRTADQMLQEATRLL